MYWPNSDLAVVNDFTKPRIWLSCYFHCQEHHSKILSSIKSLINWFKQDLQFLLWCETCTKSCVRSHWVASAHFQLPVLSSLSQAWDVRFYSVLHISIYQWTKCNFSHCWWYVSSKKLVLSALYKAQSSSQFPNPCILLESVPETAALCCRAAMSVLVQLSVLTVSHQKICQVYHLERGLLVNAVDLIRDWRWGLLLSRSSTSNRSSVWHITLSLAFVQRLLFAQVWMVGTW